MKKWLAVFLFLVVLAGVFIYFYIPGTIHIRQERNFAGNARIVYRVVMAEGGRFWQNQNAGLPGVRLIDRQLNSLTLDLNGVTTQLNFISPEADSVRLEWVANRSLPLNPVKRLQAYSMMKKVRDSMNVLMKEIQDYSASTDRVYGIRITEDHVRDSILLFTYGETEGPPSIPYIYDLVEQLKSYTASQGAGITGMPMLHVTTDDSIHFLTKVAIPVNKRLKTFGKISYKWMLGGGNILIADVHGGPGAIRNAFAQLDLYVSDHQRTPPAIPFESLISDRRLEKDTSKWVTRIYYPVM